MKRFDGTSPDRGLSRRCPQAPSLRPRPRGGRTCYPAHPIILHMGRFDNEWL